MSKKTVSHETTESGMRATATLVAAQTMTDEKLRDLEVPGAEVELEPEEAEALGAFWEDALTEEEALESSVDRDADDGQ
jgi:hypothetical protein